MAATVHARSQQDPELPRSRSAAAAPRSPGAGTLPRALLRVPRHFVYIVAIAPYRTSYVPVEHLLNAPKAPTAVPTLPPADGTRDQLTARWRESKLSELSFVGLTSALVASLFGSAFTWPIFATSSWSTKACWYCGLMCIIASITIATQQSIVLHRINSHEAALNRVRRLLSHPHKDAQGKWRADRAQMFVWQLAVMMLRFGILLFIFGLTIVLWDTAAAQAGQWSLPNLKVAITFTTVLGLVLAMHFTSVYYTYLNAAITDDDSEAFADL